MSTNCDKCGYRDNEIKSGGAISEKGKRITVKVEDREDLSRDILKVSPFKILMLRFQRRQIRAKRPDLKFPKLTLFCHMVHLGVVSQHLKVFSSKYMKN